MSNMIAKFSAYPLDHYVMPEEDHSVPARLARLEQQYAETGMRRTAEAIMVTTVRGFPHVLVLQVANAFYKIPGGYLDPSETFEDGLIARLNEQLGVPVDGGDGYIMRDDKKDWTVKECLGTWWRPHFDTFLVGPKALSTRADCGKYPYKTPQSTKPKECKKLFLVQLPPKKIFAVPLNMKLQAVPVYEFYDNAARYGPQFAGMPYWLSKFVFDERDPDSARPGAVAVAKL